MMVTTQCKRLYYCHYISHYHFLCGLESILQVFPNQWKCMSLPRYFMAHSEWLLFTRIWQGILP